MLAREQTAIFRHSWQHVGHTGTLVPGSVQPTELGGVPIALTRDESGTLHALVNVCRHRGSIVCTEAGPAPSLRCPYHAWTYDLAGRLQSAPRAAAEGRFDPGDHALAGVAIETWGPFVFACADPDAAPLATVLADLPDRVAAAGIDVDALRFLRRAPSELKANWKVCVENFLECYHCRVAHPGLAAVVATGADDYLLEAAPTYSSQYAPVRERWLGDYDPLGPVTRGQFHLLYPNTAINILPGRPNLSIGPIVPAGPAMTDRFLDYFVEPDADAGWIEHMLAFDDQVGAEDAVLVESVQRGMTAAPHRHGTLLDGSERLVAHFAAYVRRALA